MHAGPFNFEEGKPKGSLPNLHLNAYSWSKVNNINKNCFPKLAIKSLMCLSLLLIFLWLIIFV